LVVTNAAFALDHAWSHAQFRAGLPKPSKEAQEKVMAKSIKKTETFQIEAPDAADVALVGDFTDWQKNPVLMSRQKNGVWKASVRLDPGEHEYRFLVDGQWRNDNSCPLTRPNPYGETNSVRHVAP